MFKDSCRKKLIHYYSTLMGNKHFNLVNLLFLIDQILLQCVRLQRNSSLPQELAAGKTATITLRNIYPPFNTVSIFFPIFQH